MTQHKHTWTGTVLCTVALASLAMACEPQGTEGEEGKFNFQDLTPQPDVDLGGGSRQVDRPMAVGSTMRVGVTGASTVASAQSSDLTIFRVAQIQDTRVSLEGLAPGTAHLEVTGDDGTTNRIVIEVSAIANTELHLLPWRPDNLDQRPQDLYPTMAMLPNAIVDLSVIYVDDNGSPLSGSGLHTWAMDAEGMAASLDTKEGGDIATLRSGEITGTLQLTFGDQTLPIDVIDESAITALELFIPIPGDGLTLENGVLEIVEDRFVLLGIAGLDASGRYVIGAGSSSASATEEGDAGLLDIVGGNFEPGPFANSRTFMVKAPSTGETTLTVSWFGLHKSITVRAVPAPAE
ncbi:MAG: hypothetical protein AAFS10_02185 [Myxococcota bacterium]